MTADTEGRFRMEASEPSSNALLLVGVSARLGGGSQGAASRVLRRLVALPPSGSVRGDSLLPIVPWVETGTVFLFGSSLPSTWRLLSGENYAQFTWEAEGERSTTEVRVAADLEAPEILEVSTMPREVRAGETVTILVRAIDAPRGLASGMAENAWIHLEGPGGFEKAILLERRGRRAGVAAPSEAIYTTTVALPREIPSGVLWVRRVKVEDRFGRATEIRAEGLSSDVRNPREASLRALRGGLLIGFGIAVGASL
jgi:hypothetical protein